MMGMLPRGRVSRTLTPIAAALVAALALTATPVQAQPDPPPPGPDSPYLADGVWAATMISNSTVTPSGASAAADYRGNARITSTDGVLEGSWAITGSSSMSGSGVGGAAAFDAEGVVAGRSDQPLFSASSARIEGVVEVDGVARSFSQPVAGMSGIVITLTHVTCSVVIGRWDFSAAAFTGGGDFIATRIGDLAEGTDEEDYEEQIRTLAYDVTQFEGATLGDGAVDSAELSSLVERANNLNRALRRASECEPDPDGDVRRYLSMLAGVMARLVRFALLHADLFDEVELLELTNALVGSGGMTDGLHEQLVNEWGERLNEAIEEDDRAGILAALAGLGLLGADEVGAAGEEIITLLPPDD